MEHGNGWARDIYGVFKAHEIAIVSYVPDAGHRELIALCEADDAIRVVPLTTEEEGVALAAGAHLGGRRAALLMQSSGVGNCVNMFSLITACDFPFLTLVTMRGEFGEFNPWQVPMGQAVPATLAAMGLIAQRAADPDEVGEVVDGAARLAFHSSRGVAVLLAQRMIGAKRFTEGR
ncbi:MAG: Sulfopyruvate decarboxylase - alpha subunit [uncultured Thermomicrobiales bacterium]|uniref:Sulfopyruvate decarboxylase - alpha subunit n=1 Tax=uncultured Thermomicrobiales bacterium TaxID=1645740 RepID=A0A6J4VST3_9BACT|nr:MAG: Sulfopyruvate decarboxylase - alpha subunit [uncultured Thermomicrobiales bacterium]